VSIPINKTVVNKSSKTITPEGFSFLLHNVGTGKDIVVKSDKEGKAKCELVFTENDIGKTYDYRLTEVNDGIKGVKYSREVYNISITISLNKNNKLVASFTKNGEVVTKLSAKFVNEYEYIKDGNDPDENPDGDNNPDNKNPDKNSNKDKNSGKDKNSNKDKNSGKDKDNDDSNGGYSDSDNPKTGHESNLHLWFAALAVSGLGIIGSVIGRRKRVKKA